MTTSATWAVERGKTTASGGFFSIFSNPPQQCGGLNRQIDQQRMTLERMQNEFEQLNGGTAQRAAQRQQLLVALGNLYLRARSTERRYATADFNV